MDSRLVNSKKLVSACLAGINTTFRSTNNLNCKVKDLFDKNMALAVCPEVMGGLGVPRENIEIVGGDGYDVLDGRARVITRNGRDVTKAVLAGANKVLKLLKKYNIKEAVLKSASPTCGSGHIHDGAFSGTLRKGDGVLTALLKRNGVKVMTEKEV